MHTRVRTSFTTSTAVSLATSTAVSLATSGDEWTAVDPVEDAITINIGDMLMRWSDDRLVSNFHRVRAPGPGDHKGAR